MYNVHTNLCSTNLTKVTDWQGTNNPYVKVNELLLTRLPTSFDTDQGAYVDQKMYCIPYSKEWSRPATLCVQNTVLLLAFSHFAEAAECLLQIFLPCAFLTEILNDGSHLDWDVNVIQELSMVFYGSTGWEEDHDLLVQVLLQESEQEKEALLWWYYAVSLFQAFPCGQSLLVVHSNIQRLPLEAQPCKIFHLRCFVM